MNAALWRCPKFALSIMAAALAWQQFEFPMSSKDHASKVWCDNTATPSHLVSYGKTNGQSHQSPTWL
jgi:hypothetical protein